MVSLGVGRGSPHAEPDPGTPGVPLTLGQTMGTQGFPPQRPDPGIPEVHHMAGKMPSPQGFLPLKGEPQGFPCHQTRAQDTRGHPMME